MSSTTGATLPCSSAIVDAYGGESGQVVCVPTAQHLQTSGATLPFTGLDVFLIVAVAIVLVALGIISRRLSTSA